MLASVSDVIFSLDSSLSVFLDGRRLPKLWVEFLLPRLLPLLVPLGFVARAPVFGEPRSIILGRNDVSRMQVKRVSAWSAWWFGSNIHARREVHASRKNLGKKKVGRGKKLLKKLNI